MMCVFLIVTLVAVNVNHIYGQVPPFVAPPNGAGFPPNARPGFPPNGPNAGFNPNGGAFPPNGATPNGPGGFRPNGPIPQQGRVFPGGNGIVSGDRYTYGTCYFNETGSNVRGRIDARQLRTGGPVQFRVQVVGLPPSLMSDTEHGIHVHEYGDLGRGCYAAGPHYDSDSFSFHGSPNNLGAGNSHEGDMGNLRQSNSGVIDAELTLPLMTLSGDLGVVGRAIVLKEGRDDLGRGGNAMSLQTGNAGAPIACCVIGYSDSTNWQNPFIPRGFQSQPGDSQLNPGFNQGQGGFNNQGQGGFNNQGQGGFNNQGQGGFNNQGQGGFNNQNNAGFPGNFQG